MLSTAGQRSCCRAVQLGVLDAGDGLVPPVPHLDFGDGTGTTTGGTQTDHVYPFTNTCYKTRLTVFDANGNSSSVFHRVTFCTVGPCNPVCPPSPAGTRRRTVRLVGER